MTASQREAARLAYNIPAMLKARILPPETASIQTLCEFKLPPISPSLPTISAAAFFSTQAPAVMSSEFLSKLKYLAIPPIKKLLGGEAKVQNNYSKCGHSVREGTSPTNGRRPKLQFRFLVWIDSANLARPIHQIADQIAQRLVGNTANSQSNIIRC
ncbi:hypothetical protein C8J56DRAFT_1113550 [Mycena floridula]|nr:hypothetical protein C8J56DRAFT_1113550 [Mycena floridula]